MTASGKSPPFDQLAPQVASLAARDGRDYEEARRRVIWNKRLDDTRAPAAIVTCINADQVAAAIRFAASHDLKVAPRGSGHSYIAAPLRDDGLLLDLGSIDFVKIDAERRRARVGPGVRGGDLIEQLAAHGLGFPIGHCSTVAMGGYLLAGGIGWNCGDWGPACHSVTAIEVVTADGETLRASETEHPELLWAARGAGPGFFAAVTAYELMLHPLPSAAHLWTASFVAQDAPLLADWLTSATRTADATAEIMCLVGPDIHGAGPAITIRAVAMGHAIEDARSRVASFRSPPSGARLLRDPTEQDLDFSELTRLSVMPDGKRVAVDQIWSDAPLGELLLAVQYLADAPGEHSTINLVAPGGMGRIPGIPDAAKGALSVGGGVTAGIYAMWDDPADDDAQRDWVRRADVVLAPLRTGRYIGEADLTAGSDRVEDCFTPAALDRLEAARRHYDPAGRFFDFPRPT